MFDTPSKLLFDENTIVSNVGVQQRDPLLPILFSLGITKLHFKLEIYIINRLEIYNKYKINPLFQNICYFFFISIFFFYFLSVYNTETYVRSVMISS